MTPAELSEPPSCHLRTSWDGGGSAPDCQLLIRWRCTNTATRDEFLDEIQQRFSILSVYSCEWSAEHWAWNLSRFYGGRSMESTTKLREIGFEPFLAVIVSDDAPLYGPCESMGGEVDIGNRNVVAFKSQIRSSQGRNICHSSSSRSEFLAQSTLLLGPEEAARSQSVVTCWNGEFSSRNSDIEGAAGWESFERLLAYLNLTCRWLILRNFENLPTSLFDENDVDILTDDMELFSAIAGLKSCSDRLSLYFGYIGGRRIEFDLHCIGDGDYPTLWQSDLLTTRMWNKAQIPIPNPVHQFFSLLYHAYLHKPYISERYISSLVELADRINFVEVTGATLRDEPRSARILSGFMKRRLYPLTRPVDSGMFWNRRFASLVSGFEIGTRSVMRKRKALRLLRDWLPNWTYRIFSTRFKTLLKNRLNH